MPMFRKPDAQDERAFEKKHIFLQMEPYLEMDVILKIANYRGYKAKVKLIENALGDVSGYVLDIGANTFGEAEYLTTKGFSIIATDINEYALSISQERVVKFSM